MSKSILYTTVWRKWIEYCPPSLMHIHTPAHTQPYIYTHTFRWFVLFATSVGVRKNTRWRSSWSGSLEGLITNNPTTLLSPPFLLLSLSLSLSVSVSLFLPFLTISKPALLPPPSSSFPSPPLLKQFPKIWGSICTAPCKRFLEKGHKKLVEEVEARKPQAGCRSLSLYFFVVLSFFGSLLSPAPWGK